MSRRTSPRFNPPTVAFGWREVWDKPAQPTVTPDEAFSSLAPGFLNSYLRAIFRTPAFPFPARFSIIAASSR